MDKVLRGERDEFEMVGVGDLEDSEAAIGEGRGIWFQQCLQKNRSLLADG